MEALIRIHRPRSWFGAFRKLNLLIDGVLATQLRNGERVELSVAPGARTLQLKMDWCVSPDVDVLLAPTDELHFECVMPRRKFRAAFIAPGEAFQLVQIDPNSERPDQPKSYR